MTVIFCFSCLWKYGFGYLAAIDNSHHASVANFRSIYAQLEVQFPGQLLYFSAGVLLLLYFDKLKHHFFAISCITAFIFLLDHWVAAGLLDVFWISGFVFVSGFWRWLGNFSKHGDFSYGIYIVHWPILQTMIALGLTGLNPVVFSLTSLSLIFLAAFLMWNLVESRFLASSSHYRQVTQESPA
jgi:peptidoglycan/LPS O-acetylase OafA/YrhL